MFQHALLLLYRHAQRFPGTFLINLVGLSTGLACALTIYLWIQDERSFDAYHALDHRLFQVMENQRTARGIDTRAGTAPRLAETLREEMPEIEYAVAATPANFFPKFTLAVPGKHVTGVGKFVGPEFFQLFSYPLLQGAPAQVLADKQAVVLSEALATKLFGSPANSLGQTVELQLNMGDLKRTGRISGVFAALPRNSSELFDFVLPFSVFKDIMHMEGPVNWADDGPFATYLALKEGASAAQFNAKLAGYLRSKSAQAAQRELFIRPYSAAYLHSVYENGVPAGGRIEYVRLFALVAVLILVIASINFMNLVTAKASRRMKEVGIRKALGASRAMLVGQYLTESTAIALLALGGALLLVGLLLPAFNEMTGKHLALTWDFRLVLAFLGIGLATGLLAGSYPAFYLSGFRPAAVLKGKLAAGAADRWTRQGLVVFQFTLSVLFIVAVLVINRQLAFVQRKSLGYDKQNVLYFETAGRAAQRPAAFLAEVQKLPGVVSASALWGGFLGERGPGRELEWQGHKVLAHTLLASYDLLKTLRIRIKEGRSFSRQFRSDTAGIVVNEALVAGLGMTQPVGQRLGQARILGVVHDFHYESLHEKVRPLIVRLEPQAGTLMVKLQAGQEQATLGRLQRLYTTYAPGFTLEYQFLEADYQAQYAAERRVAVLSRYFAGLAILISCLGLLGLSTFTAERRRKEIGIRKALGASEWSVVFLLSKDLTRLVVVAIALALPLSYLVMRHWLADFAYRIDLRWWYFASAGLGALLLAWLTVGGQALRAARNKPVQSLREE
ncbi:FtsX-like permease family protein [Hymenobacter sp. DG01]|uniref:FtsX-like permease family protein n=1 Tax=Hymenobacter sp. DG01 TaxID=2584940 RepID=UPI00111FC648|nr:FtsX-like permease family protein [Hymenobacter sp. DG01]